MRPVVPALLRSSVLVGCLLYVAGCDGTTPAPPPDPTEALRGSWTMGTVRTTLLGSPRNTETLLDPATPAVGAVDVTGAVAARLTYLRPVGSGASYWRTFRLSDRPVTASGAALDGTAATTVLVSMKGPDSREEPYTELRAGAELYYGSANLPTSSASFDGTTFTLRADFSTSAGARADVAGSLRPATRPFPMEVWTPLAETTSIPDRLSYSFAAGGRGTRLRSGVTTPFTYTFDGTSLRLTYEAVVESYVVSWDGARLVLTTEEATCPTDTCVRSHEGTYGISVGNLASLRTRSIYTSAP